MATEKTAKSEDIPADVESTVQAAVAAKKKAEEFNTNMNALGYRKTRPWYELGIGSGLGRIKEGSLVEGSLQVIAAPAVGVAGYLLLDKYVFGTAGVPAGFTCCK